MTSAPNRIFSSRIPNANAFGNEPLGTAEGSSGNLHEKLQCGQAMGISRISSGDTVSRDLHLWHSNVIARISSNPTTILRSKVTLPEVYHAEPSPPTIPQGTPISQLGSCVTIHSRVSLGRRAACESRCNAIHLEIPLRGLEGPAYRAGCAPAFPRDNELADLPFPKMGTSARRRAA